MRPDLRGELARLTITSEKGFKEVRGPWALTSHLHGLAWSLLDVAHHDLHSRLRARILGCYLRHW